MAAVSKGAAGEVLAARFLRNRGYDILTANYRTRLGEIDIIAADKQYIAFVEVKNRNDAAIYAPREAVTKEKQRRILRTAARFLQQHPTPLQPRFDVVEVLTAADDPMKVLEIDHIQGAYEAGDLQHAF